MSIAQLIMDIRFIFWTKENTEFDSICRNFSNDLRASRNKIKTMRLEDVYALKEYAKIGSRLGCLIWIEAELQRREFIFRKITLIISLLALVISVVAYFQKVNVKC